MATKRGKKGPGMLALVIGGFLAWKFFAKKPAPRPAPGPVAKAPTFEPIESWEV